MKLEPTRDVAALPTYASGPLAPLWWGNLAFIVIEGLGFAMSVAVYLYLWSRNSLWPPDAPPDLLWSSLMTGLLLLSTIPNHLTKRAAEQHDLRGVRIGVLFMGVVGIAAIGLRVMEFTTLNTRWDSNAYGSVVWLLIGLHTTHLLADVGETLVIGVLLLAGPVDMRRFSDVEDNQDYWNFVVLTWVVVYLTLYWLPRWLPGGAP